MVIGLVVLRGCALLGRWVVFNRRMGGVRRMGSSVRMGGVRRICNIRRVCIVIC